MKINFFTNFRFIALSLFFIISTSSLSYGASPIRVVTSIPDLADMAREIGGDKVEVTSLSTGREDLHAVPLRPSFAVKLSRADLLLNLGLDAEHSWLNALAEESRNRRVMYQREGWIEVYKGIEILEKPRKLDRAKGHQHPLGNPHYNVGPQNGKIMAQNIARAFMDFDPQNADYYNARLAAYLQKIDLLIIELQEKGKNLKGIRIVVYHPDMVYLTNFYGMVQVGSLEPKPGIQPGANHLFQLSKTIKVKKVKFIVYNQAQSPSIAGNLARRNGIRAVQMANAVGAKPSIKSWIDLQRYNLNQFLKEMDSL